MIAPVTIIYSEYFVYVYVWEEEILFFCFGKSDGKNPWNLYGENSFNFV